MNLYEGMFLLDNNVVREDWNNELGVVGCRSTKLWHHPSSHHLKKVRLDRLAMFESAEKAESLGFRPVSKESPLAPEPL